MAEDRLTRTGIGTVVLRELDRALALYPVWKHPFAGLEFNRAKRMFGQAHHDGRIVISQQFIGTTALADLEDTIRHEFAHLIVGINARHGPAWKAVAASLGARPRATGKSQAADLQERMSDAPLTLLAVMQNGERRVMKAAFRRSRRYVDYRLGKGQQKYHIKGELIERFVYEDRRAKRASEVNSRAAAAPGAAVPGADVSDGHVSADKDREIGQELQPRLHRLTERLATRHGIDPKRAADYLLAGSLFTAADVYGLSIDETVEVMQEIAASVQEDELEPETRH